MRGGGAVLRITIEREAMSEKLLCIQHRKVIGRIHIAERAIASDLPEWRKLPYCRNGGLTLRNWQFVEIVPTSVYAADVCGGCLKRASANGFDFGFARRTGAHAHTCLACESDRNCIVADCKEESFELCNECAAQQVAKFGDRI